MRKDKEQPNIIKEHNNKTENTLEAVNKRLNEAEEWVSELKDNSSGNHCQWKKKRKKNENKEQFKRLLGQHQANIHITGVPEGEESKKGTENLFEEITAENVPNLVKETDIQVQKHSLKQIEPKVVHTKTHYN